MKPDAEIAAFREHLVARGYRESTVGLYTRILKSALKSGDLVAYATEQRAPGWRISVVSALKKWGEWAGKRGKPVLAAIDALPRQRQRETPPERPLSMDEWDAMLAGIEKEEEPLGHILELLARSGLRANDVLQIERPRAKESLGVGVLALVQKGGGFRPFPVEGNIKNCIEQLLDHEWDVLWQAVSSASQLTAYRTLYRGLRRAAERARLDPKEIHPHRFRTTVALQVYYASGKDILVVQKWLGHKDVATTMRYLRYFDPEALAGTSRALDEWRKKQ